MILYWNMSSRYSRMPGAVQADPMPNVKLVDSAGTVIEGDNVTAIDLEKGKVEFIKKTMNGDQLVAHYFVTWTFAAPIKIFDKNGKEMSFENKKEDFELGVKGCLKHHFFDLVQPGDFMYVKTFDDPTSLLFVCPCGKCDRKSYAALAPTAPSYYPWNRNQEQPSLTGIIECRCGWKGCLTDGVFINK